MSTSTNSSSSALRTTPHSKLPIQELPELPSVGAIYGEIAAKTARGFFIKEKKSSGKSLPEAPKVEFVVRNHQIRSADVADYTDVCGLRLGSAVPVTYPFVITFPLAMKLMADKDFPFPAAGTVHLNNRIAQYQPIPVNATVDIGVYAENIREHRSGLLIDFISRVSIDGALAWEQTSTFLRKKRTSLSSQPRPLPRTSPPGFPTQIIHVTRSIIRRYAQVSGDKNPIHISTLGARVSGFPKTIAHGMWSAASMLRAVEGRIPEKVIYDIQFGKPLFLPGTAVIYSEELSPGWQLSFRNPVKNLFHVSGTLTPLG